MVETLYIKPSATQLMETNFSFTVHATLTNGCEVEENIPIINNTKTWNDAGEVDWFDGSKWLPLGEPTLDQCVIIHTIAEIPLINRRSGFAKNVKVKEGVEEALELINSGAGIEILNKLLK